MLPAGLATQVLNRIQVGTAAQEAVPGTKPCTRLAREDARVEYHSMLDPQDKGHNSTPQHGSLLKEDTEDMFPNGWWHRCCIGLWSPGLINRQSCDRSSQGSGPCACADTRTSRHTALGCCTSR
jgi:hypothetical protein